MSEKGIYSFKPTVNIGYPGKSETHPGSHGKFLCDKAENGEYLADKDTYDLKEYFTPAERESFYGHVKGILQGLEIKYPPTETITYREADTLVNEKTGNTYQKLKEGGNTLKEATFKLLPEEEQKNYKKYTTPEMSYSITGNHYEKDGKARDTFQLTITSNKHEAIRVSFDKDCQAKYIGYNKDNSFNSGKPAAENKWVNCDAKTQFTSPVLQNFAKDLAASITRSDRTSIARPTIFTEVSKYVSEHSPKVTNKEGKEVGEYYTKGYFFKGSVIKDNDGNVLKDKDGNPMKYRDDNFSFYNHSSEMVTFYLTDGDITKVSYANFADKTKNAFSREGLTGIQGHASEGFFNLVNDALNNYDKNLQQTNEEIAKAVDDKENDFMEFNEQDEINLPF